ncbi:MAG: LPXTG cell wall anchor domain-containing protein [Nitrosopumilus sp.]|nr:LPXTG cell wall anchor domain-containing protein [Nitrosopumilus sp.]
MRYSTEELQQRLDSGQSIGEISKETGLSNWTLYKRFQRLKPDTQNYSDKELPRIATGQNATTRPKTSLAEMILVFGALATIIGIFLYKRRQNEDDRELGHSQMSN